MSAAKDEVAEVDFLVDERGNRVEVPEDTPIKVAQEADPTVGATGPTNWWRLGLVALAVVIAILLILQLLNGNAGTDVIPATPQAAPQVETGS